MRRFAARLLICLGLRLLGFRPLQVVAFASHTWDEEDLAEWTKATLQGVPGPKQIHVICPTDPAAILVCDLVPIRDLLPQKSAT